MTRQLPCSRCPDRKAKLKTPTGLIPYAMGGPSPSAFRTIGVDFRYRCQGCGTEQTIGKRAFYALPVVQE